MWGFLPEEAVFQWCAHALHNSTGRSQTALQPVGLSRLLLHRQETMPAPRLPRPAVTSLVVTGSVVTGSVVTGSVVTSTVERSVFPHPGGRGGGLPHTSHPLSPAEPGGSCGCR